MQFKFEMDETIPLLSWCLRIDRNNPVIHCIHGAWVETGENFFVEGGWAEDFAAGNLAESLSLMGSGAVLHSGSIVLCTPCHVIECIYSAKQAESIVFSNSLAFLLSAVGWQLDPHYLGYESDILSIARGIREYKRFIPTQCGEKIQLHYYCNITVDEQLNVSCRDKLEQPEFKNFDEYYKYLVDTTTAIKINLTDTRRKKQFSPIVFCSSGYDSAACAVIGRQIGCDEAVVYESRKGIRSDSGKQIVEALGYTVIHEKHELDYLAYDVAEDFVSSGELGTAIFYGSSQAELTGKYLLSGDHGDCVWKITDAPRSSDFVRQGTGLSTAMKEFRLRVGFIKVAIPFFGASQEAAIDNISNSQEMEPWRMHNDYDKPIPRRIIETAGIARGQFAVRKDGGVGNSLRLLGMQHLQKVMPSGSYRDFQQYYRENRRFRNISFAKINRSLHYLVFLSFISLGKVMLKSNCNWIKLNELFPQNERIRMSCSPWAPSLLFNWGLQKVRRRYENAGRQLMQEAN